MACRRCVSIAILMAGWLVGWQGASAATNFLTIHRFRGGRDGDQPVAALTADNAGNLYGTTGESYGMPGKQCSKGCGNTYSVDNGGTEHSLFSFDGKDGAKPLAPLLYRYGKLFGTTAYGGAYNSGTVFKLTAGGSETILHEFCNAPLVSNNSPCPDGAFPAGRLIADSTGNLYGTTVSGGANNANDCNAGCGTIFRIAKNGTFSVLYSFCSQPNCSDGAVPSDGLTLGKDGALYGSASLGGANNFGAVFRINTDGSAETVLYSFCSMTGCADGGNPHGDLIFDGNGNIYGSNLGGEACCGVVFELSAPDYNTATVLWTFDGTDGSLPSGGVIRDSSGNLYGLTEYGGTHTRFCNWILQGIGCGTVYEITSSGEEIVLHNFAGPGDGALPFGGLLLQGNYLFGTASWGGDPYCDAGIGCGTVFKIQLQ